MNSAQNEDGISGNLNIFPVLNRIECNVIEQRVRGKVEEG